MIGKRKDINAQLFLRSALTAKGGGMQTSEVLDWISERNRLVHVHMTPTPIRDIKGWRWKDGRIQHDSGKFFSIDGISIQTNWGGTKSWSQPIINQPEVGYLGIITREINGVLHFLLQAKIEPGNVNHVQLSPTLQATRSNYSRVHKGKEPIFLSYFRDATSEQILLDQLQSEQGARFLRKRNRNIILKIDEEIPNHEDFVWLTLGQIKELMRVDNLVNMDTRTVISGISYGNYSPDVVGLLNFITNSGEIGLFKSALLGSALSGEPAVNTFEDIITFLTRLKSEHDLFIERTPLESLDEWVIDEMDIHHREQKYFRVIGMDVEIGNREVQSWSQPMVEPTQEGLCALVCKEIYGVLHFAMQAKLECGNHDIVELAPTVQCLTGNYRHVKGSNLPFLDYVLNAPVDHRILDTLQSEEGGRFHREQNRNVIIFAGDEVPLDLPNNFIWLTLNQIQTFLKFNNYLNIQARSLIAALDFT